MTETLREEKPAADTNTLRTAASTRARRAESVEVSRKKTLPVPRVSTFPKKVAMTTTRNNLRGKEPLVYSSRTSGNVMVMKIRPLLLI